MMTLDEWFDEELKSKKFRKSYAKFMRRLVREYVKLVHQEYGVVYADPEEIKAFRKRLKRERKAILPIDTENTSEIVWVEFSYQLNDCDPLQKEEAEKYIRERLKEIKDQIETTSLRNGSWK